MTNQEARGILENLEADYRNLDPLVLTDDSIRLVNKRIEALGAAISALQVQDFPDTNVGKMCEDAISRQAAIDAMTNTLWHYPNECYRNLNKYEFVKGLAELGLKSVPSAQPKPSQTAKDIATIIQNEKDMRVIAQNAIIHCRDCKHYICHDKRCGYWNHGVKPLDWCCHGERRTDERF